MRFIFFLPWLAVVALAAAPGPALSGTLRLAGSSTMAPTMAELARRFRLRYPGMELVIEAGGSSRGAADTLAGRADIGMVARALHPDERALFVFTVARDGVALQVHRDNPLTQLTRAQAIGLLTGRIGNWKALGGPDAPVDVISRKEGHSSLEIVAHYFGLAPGDIKATAIAGDNGEALQLLADNRNALAFYSIGVCEDAMQRGIPVKAPRLDGLEASVRSVRAGKWPLARPLNLVTRAVPTGAAKAFIEFALSPQARDIIREHDFIPYER